MGFQDKSMRRSDVAMREDRDGVRLANLGVRQKAAKIVSKPRLYG